MDNKRKTMICLLCFLLFVLCTIEKTDNLIENAYVRVFQEFYPGKSRKNQPLCGIVFGKFVRIYKNDFLPVLAYVDDYQTTSEDDLVQEEYFDLQNDEQKENKVEEVPKKNRKFNLKRWENANYLRKYIYQVDSTTMITNSELNGKLLLNMNLSLKKTRTPQILIYHTHGSEAYKDSKKGKKSDTVIGVGDVLASSLKNKYHWNVIHDRNIYDVKNGKEERSKAYFYAAASVKKYLKQYPEIQVIIDLHRDGVKESTKLITSQQGKKMAQIMFFNGISRTAKNGDIPYLYNKNKKNNLAFSLQLQALAMERHPGLTRKIYLKGYRYNLHFRGRSLLVEVGAQNNTVLQAKRSMKFLAEIINLELT